MKRLRGQGLVEFALILPILLLIILGIVEAAFVIQGYLTVQHAAREAARFATTYQPFQGQKLDGSDCDYTTAQGPPFTDPAQVCNRYEDYPEYHARRVALIKQEARRAAAGLRVDDAHLGDTPERFGQHMDEPAFFGIAVWGYPSFQVDCNAYGPWDSDNPCLDHPGLEGLPVQVLVRHNVEIVDPFYRVIAEYVPVQADAEMINEGVQVGFGDVPPPDFSTNPDLDEPPVDPIDDDDDDDDDGDDDDGGASHTYSVELDVAHATNAMPGDRAHRFVATVTDELSRTVQGARVSFSTDEGGFSYTGVDPKYAEETTDGDGRASVTLFGNRPVTATIRAWLDYSGNEAWDAGEPYDTARKTWTVSGPHILVSKHQVYPEVDSIYIDVMDHDPADSPYRLLWCVISGTNTSAAVQDTVYVDAGGDATDLGFQIPADSEGLYRLETHADGGDCGADDLVAYSADIRAVVLPPDLTIAGFEIPDLICPETVFTMSVVIENLSPSGTDQPFDVDFYVDPEYAPPQSPIGNIKQWVSGIEPYGTAVVNTLMWVGSPPPGEYVGEHRIWARVDASNYVDEGWQEDNNAGVITVTTGSLVGESADTGWRSPSANAADSGGDGDGFEDNPAGAYAEGGGVALNEDGPNDRHQYSNYGFNIPPGSIVQGIRVRLRGRVRSTYRRQGWYEVELSWDGGSNWTGAHSTSYLGTSIGNYHVGGQSDLWGHNWTADELSGANFRARITSGASGYYGERTDFELDWVPVEVTYASPGECQVGDDDPPWLEDDIKPPGLRECQQLLQAGDFEGNFDRVFSYWHAGEQGAYQHQARYFYDGSMSVRLHASLGSYPVCPALSPYLFQTVEIPTEVYTMTTMHVRGQRLVAESESRCCFATTDADDILYLQMKNGAGGDLGTGTQIANGGVVSRTWAAFEEEVTDVVGPYARAGETLQVYFHATHDGDDACTFFYLDALECEVCTGWPVPPDVDGTASFGGLVQVLVQGFAQSPMGIDVWAYSQGGQVYHTYTIQDGTYHFYNVPPGTYTIYAEFWEGSVFHYGTWTVTVAADERNYNVNLYMS